VNESPASRKFKSGAWIACAVVAFVATPLKSGAQWSAISWSGLCAGLAIVAFWLAARFFWLTAREIARA